jgi:hypothetical protein
MSILNTYNRNSIDKSSYSYIAKFEGKKLKIKKDDEGLISQPPTKDLYSEARFFKFCDQSENSHENNQPQEGSNETDDEALIEEMSLQQILQ